MGAGLGWIYLFASIPNESSTMIFIVFMGLIGGILAGASVGAITRVVFDSAGEKNIDSALDLNP